MLIRFPLSIAGLLCGLLAGLLPAQAAAPAAGVITGRVSNAATGAYLQRARVAVRGTEILALTDDSGAYHLAEVAPGPVTLEVFYTGLDPLTATVNVTPGGTAERDFVLSSAARYGTGDGTVRLDPFRVATARETDGQAIAINEQRFSPNLKSVVSTETLGDPLGGSVGDFLRFLPGVAAAYGALETEGVLIRGFPSGMTIVSSDGMQLAGANASGERDFSPSRVGVNSISRVEVTKVPLPSSPADTMSGSINLVTKSAFERSRAELRWRAGISSSEQSFAFGRTPAPDNERSYKLLPDLSLDYTLPLSRDLGLVITALHSVTSFETDTWYTDYRASATGTNATPANPYLWRHRNVEVSRDYERDSLSLKLDWRPHRHAVFSFGGTVNYYDHNSYNSQFNPTLGNVGTPSVAGGRALSFTESEVLGATGRGSVAQSFSFAKSNGLNVAGDLRYRYDDGTWRIQASGSRSNSKAWRRDTARGFFNSVAVGLAVPVRLNYRGIREGNLSDFEVFDNADRPVDAFNLGNYAITSAAGVPNTDIRATITGGGLDVRRRLGFLPFPAALQIGGLHRVQTNDDVRLNGRTYNYNGVNGDRSATPYLAEVYYGTRKFSTLASKPHVPWVSPHKVWTAFTANPALFSQTLAQERTTLSNNLLQSKYIEETASAGYLQMEASGFRNRLNAVTGVRFERTTDIGFGPIQDPDAVFARNPNGSFARTPTGARIRKPEAGAAGSLAEVPLIYRARAARAERSYQGYYPSLHLNFNATERLLLRAAYARTYGRPNFSNIIPNTTVNDAAQSITVTNPNLKPQYARNMDFSSEYYFTPQGMISFGAFHKKINDYIQGDSSQFVAAGQNNGYDGQYAGYRINTTANSGWAQIRGVEFNYQQQLTFLPGWAKGLGVYSNLTKLWTKGNNSAFVTGQGSSAGGTLAGFLDVTGNLGLSFRGYGFDLRLQAVYRGEYLISNSTTPALVTWQLPKTSWTWKSRYAFTRTVSGFFDIENFTSTLLDNRYAAYKDRPSYWRTFHSKVVFGVTGRL